MADGRSIEVIFPGIHQGVSTIIMTPPKNRESLLREGLERILSKIIEMGVKRVILFGSLARGDVRRTSDTDLMIL